MYWRLTPEEVSAVLKQQAAYERRADLRAGLVAATVANVHRAKGKRLIQPQDFLMVEGRRRHMTPQEGARFMRRWAKGINRDFPPPEKGVTP